MKLKYYLRGIGLGIIFATIVMTVSSGIHNNNLSDDFIIKEAQKLGMVMQEEEDDGGLWGNGSKETEKDSDVEENVGTEQESVSEDEIVTESGLTTEDTSAIEDDATAENEIQQEEVVYQTVTIVSGDSAQVVGEKLYDAGVLSDIEGFHLYLKEHGYTTKIRAGVYQIPIGASHEEICNIILKRME